MKSRSSLPNQKISDLSQHWQASIVDTNLTIVEPYCSILSY